MQTVTRSEMRARVRRKMDRENATTPTDAQINDALNNAIRRLHAKLTQLEEDYATTAYLLVTTTDQSYLELPTDFLALRAIEWLPDATATIPTILAEDGAEMLMEDGGRILTEDGSTTLSGDERPVPLERWQFRERARHYGPRNWTRGRPGAYRLLGKNSDHVERVELVPKPDGAYVVRVWYVPAAPTLDSDTSTYDGRSGFDEWVCLEASIAFLIDEESDVNALVLERERVWETQIVPLLTYRDQATPGRVIDATAWETNWYDY